MCLENNAPNKMCGKILGSHIYPKTKKNIRFLASKMLLSLVVVEGWRVGDLWPVPVEG